MISIFNPWVLFGALLSGIGLFGAGFYVGSDYTEKSIAAGQKKALDVAIVKHEEVAKNDLTKAIKVETSREEKKAIFRGIQLKNENRPGDNLATISDESFRLWNDANRAAIKNATSKPINPLPTTATINEKR